MTSPFLIPDGYILGIILFGIPYLLARKNDSTLIRDTIWYYMDKTEQIYNRLLYKRVMKKVNCYNCGKEFMVEEIIDDDNFECIECKGNDIEWSQTD